MKTIVIYSSKHRMNTEKVAQAIAAELGADLRRLADVKPADLEGYDLVGLGSGINGFDVHPEMNAFVDSLPDGKGRRVFLFTTCAAGQEWTGRFKEKLAAKGLALVGEFVCTGVFVVGPFKLRKGHPDQADLDAARAFARKLAAGPA